MEQTISITFGDVAENNIGMQKIGKEETAGFSYRDLLELQEKHGGEMVVLGHGAYVLVLRQFVPDWRPLWQEQLCLPFDKKALFRGKVKINVRGGICVMATNIRRPTMSPAKAQLLRLKTCRC